MLRAIRNCSSWLSLVTSICVTAQFSILAASRINPNKQNDVRNTISVTVIVDVLVVGFGYLFFVLLRPSSENTTRKTTKEKLVNMFTLFVQFILDAIAWLVFIPVTTIMSFFTYSFCTVIVDRSNKMLHDVFELWGSCAVLLLMLLSNGIIFATLYGIVWCLTRYPKRSAAPLVLKFSSFLLDVQLWLPRLFTATSTNSEHTNIVTRGVRVFETYFARPTATVCSYMFLSILYMAVFHEERAMLRYIQYALNITPFMRYVAILAVSFGFITNIILVSKKNMPKSSILFIILCVLLDALHGNEIPSKYKNKSDIWVDNASKMIIDFGYKTGNAKAMSGGWIVITPYITDAFNTSVPTFTDPSLLGYKQDEYEGTILHERGHIDTRVFWTMISALVFASNFHGFNLRRGHESARTLFLYFTSITAVSWCDELVADMSAGDKVRSYVVRGWGTVGARAHPPGVLRFLAGDLSRLYNVMQYLNYLAYAICIVMIVHACRSKKLECKEEIIVAGEENACICEEAG